MERIRAFVAIELPGGLIARLGNIAEELRKRAGGGVRGISWAKPENIHLTIKFLGDIDPRNLEKVRGALAEAAVGVPPFRVACTGLGGFPSIKRPRVIWVGMDDCPELAALSQRIEERLAPLGFEREKRSFHPHLTICRVKPPADARALGRAAEAMGGAGGGGGGGGAGGGGGDGAAELTVESFVLMRSELSPKGAKHTVLERIPLDTRTCD